MTAFYEFIINIRERPDNVDFKQVDSGVHQLKGSSSRFVTVNTAKFAFLVLSDQTTLILMAQSLLCTQCRCKEGEKCVHIFQGMLRCSEP
jgi:histidine-containing phosphotransfer protein